MPFQKGHTLSRGLGRPKGSPNKTTNSKIKEDLKILLEDNMGQLREDQKQLSPRDRVTAIVNLFKYELPTKKAVEVEDISDKPSGLDWIDDIMRMNPDELHKKIGNGI